MVASLPLPSTMTSLCAHETVAQKGDRFETDCYYNTDLSSVGSDNVTFGLGSENEMYVGIFACLELCTTANACVVVTEHTGINPAHGDLDGIPTLGRVETALVAEK